MKGGWQKFSLERNGKLLDEERFGWVIDWQAFEAFRAISWRQWTLSFLIHPKVTHRFVFSPDGKYVAVAWEPNMVGLLRVRLPKE